MRSHWFKLLTSLAAGFGALAFSPWAAANLETAVNGLSDGARYRVVFTTSTVHQAGSADIGDYDGHVAAAAAADGTATSALGLSWQVIGSTATVDARDHLGASPGDSTEISIFRIDGTLVASSYADLWDGTLASSLGRTENNGEVPEPELVWTGTQTTMGAAAPGEALGDSLVAAGLSSGSGLTAGDWLNIQFGPYDKGDMYHLYAMSNVVTVGSLEKEVPEPLGVVLTGTGLLLLAASCRRRRPDLAA